MRLFRLLAACTGLVMVPFLTAAVRPTPASAAVPSEVGASVLAQTPANPVPDQYIVMLRESQVSARSLGAASSSLVRRHNGKVRAAFPSITGFSAHLSARDAAKLARDPDVLSVTQNAYVQGATIQPVPAPPKSYWGLDRIDQRTSVNRKYKYTSTGAGVRVYVIDTGVRITHRQFGGRASYGYDFVDNDRTAQDGNGHGTHVAGTIAGSTFGVAKRARIVAVRVLNNRGSGTAEQVIKGIDWVTRNARKPAVANLSLGSGYYAPINAAVARSIRSGITYTVAAGNEGANACHFSPASTPTAITVGSTGNWARSNPVTDRRSSFSNYGRCLDIFAPGALIRSSWNTSTRATLTISGTSMAAPHVAGAAARYLSWHRKASPAAVRSYLMTKSTKGAVRGDGPGSPDRLLFIGKSS